MSAPRPSRGEATRMSLLRAAAQLFAEQGVEHTTLRDILSTAGQKNESAVQHHFGSYQGLVAAAQAQWDDAVNARRSEMLAGAVTWQPTGPAHAVPHHGTTGM